MKKGNHGIFHTLEFLENQARMAYRQFKHVLPGDFIHLAIRKRNQIAREVKYYADGIVQTLDHAHILPNRNKLMKEAKKNLEGFVKKIQKSDMAHAAMKLASNKGAEVLSLLNFPTKKDVTKLNSRLNQLEKRLKSLSQRSPSA